MGVYHGSCELVELRLHQKNIERVRLQAFYALPFIYILYIYLFIIVLFIFSSATNRWEILKSRSSYLIQFYKINF